MYAYDIAMLSPSVSLCPLFQFLNQFIDSYEIWYEGYRNAGRTVSNPLIFCHQY
jgi:hypothetical protein